jgi:nicotinate-nucleotide adenylyltransferase
MRLGVFGGSFDPVHYGHLLLAECCREQCRLDEVWFVPAATPPHKQNRDVTAARWRVEMLQLAVGGAESLRVATLEVERGGVSYTIDTLTEIHRQQPEDELFLLMGADSLGDLPTWREPQAVCALAIPVVVRRAGSASPDFSQLNSIASAERLAEIQRHQVEMPIIDLSSSELRRRVAEGLSIRFRTPRAVEKFIETHDLYRQRSSSD